MNHTMHEDISTFFRQFALQHLAAADGAKPSPQAVKMMMVSHSEDIYPAFAETAVFKRCFQQEGHQQMVDEYKRCFTLLLCGRLP